MHDIFLKKPLGNTSPTVEPSLLQSSANADKDIALAKEIRLADDRIRMTKQSEKLLVPALNRIYSSIGTDQGYELCADGYCSGQVTTVAGVAVPVTLSFTPNGPWLTSKWPGSTQVYPVITFFSIAPETAIATIGNISVYYIDTSGITIPLGVFVSGNASQSSRELIIPSSITDPGNKKIGTLTFLLQGTTPSTATYDFQLGLSAAYVLPAIKGYRVDTYDHLLEENQVYEKHNHK